MTRTTLRPWKKPKPVVPWLYGLVAVLNAGCAGVYFFTDKPWFGGLWTALALLWAALVPMTLKTHRMNVRTWETVERFRREWT